MAGNSSSQDLLFQFYQTFQILPDTANFQGIFHYKLALTFYLFSYFTEQLPCKITKQVKKAMLTYDEKVLENLSFLEESEMSNKTGNLERRSHQST